MHNKQSNLWMLFLIALAAALLAGVMLMVGLGIGLALGGDELAPPGMAGEALAASRSPARR